MKARLAILMVGGAVAATCAFAGPPELPRGRGDACVAPVEVMRKQHMDFLLHQRDRTVQEGIRTSNYSLVECIDCHVQKNTEGEFVPVDAPDQFCEACHAYTSVKLDCFECHATTPDKPGEESAGILPHDGARFGVMSYGDMGLRPYSIEGLGHE